MKRILALGFCFLICASSFSQTIAYRNEDEAALEIATNYLFEGKVSLTSLFFNDLKPKAGVALAYKLDKISGDEFFSLDFVLKTYNLEFSFDKGANVYIKTFQDNVLTLHQTLDYSSINAGKETKKVSDRTSSKFYFMFPKYSITKEELTLIMREGIKIIMFMTTRGYHTLKYDKDDLGDIVSNEYSILLGKSDFTDGF